MESKNIESMEDWVRILAIIYIHKNKYPNSTPDESVNEMTKNMVLSPTESQTSVGVCWEISTKFTHRCPGNALDGVVQNIDGLKISLEDLML